ncbi:hypothetical protein K438DRAFT_1968496 [Mycena galopus ATCC 62051]|nr:hypothetical protein K438DRAFT_1968496 [Mycena galopus ATCC 62051]
MPNTTRDYQFPSPSADLTGFFCSQHARCASLHRSGILTWSSSTLAVLEAAANPHLVGASICKRVDRARPTASLADYSVFSFASQHNIGRYAFGDYDATGHMLDSPALTTSRLTLCPQH